MYNVGLGKWRKPKISSFFSNPLKCTNLEKGHLKINDNIVGFIFAMNRKTGFVKDNN